MLTDGGGGSFYAFVPMIPMGKRKGGGESNTYTKNTLSSGSSLSMPELVQNM